MDGWYGAEDIYMVGLHFGTSDLQTRDFVQPQVQSDVSCPLVTAEDRSFC